MSTSNAVTNILAPKYLNCKSLSLIDQARWFHALGFNVLAIDQHKKPLRPWKNGPHNWTVERQTAADVQRDAWRSARGLAAVLGPVSGGLCCIDFDKQPDRAAVDQFLSALGLPPDYGWLVITPGGGQHVYLRAPSLTLNSRKLDRAGRLAGHIELRYGGLLATLPGSLHPSGGVYRWAGDAPTGAPVVVDAARLLAAYEAVTIAPAPKPEPVRQPFTLADLPSNASELEEIERRVRAAIARVLIKRGHKEGYFNCPLEHGPAGKDFLFNPAPGQPIGGCQGKHAGQLTRWTDLAEYLHIDVSQIARDVAAERRAGNLMHSSSLTSSPGPGPDATRFPLGMPSTLSRRLLNWHRKVKGIQSQAPAAAVWALYQETSPAELPDGQWFSSADFRRALAERDPGRALTESGLKQLVALGVVEFCEFFDLPNKTNIYDRSKNLQNGRVGASGRRATARYRFRPVQQQLEHVERHYLFALREAAFQGIPCDAQAEFGDLTPAEVDALNAFFGAYFASHHAARGRAEETVNRAAGYLALAVQRIREGRYVPLTLSPGPIRNAKMFRDAVHAWWVQQAGGERENAYQAMFELGVSRQTVSASRARIGAITVEREKVVPLDAVTRRERDLGLVIDVKDGQARVKLPSAVKLVDQATAHEIAAYRALCDAQRARRRAGTAGAANTKAPPATGADQSKPLTVPADFSDAFKEHQALIRWPAALPPYDPQTGEVYTPAQLWRALAAYVQRAESEAEVTTFTTFSEPRETEYVDQPVELPSLSSGDSDDRPIVVLNWPQRQPVNFDALAVAPDTRFRPPNLAWWHQARAAERAQRARHEAP